MIEKVCQGIFVNHRQRIFTSHHLIWNRSQICAIVRRMTLMSSRQGPWTEIYLDNPRTRNALSSALVEHVITELDKARSDASTIAVIIAGRSEGFCSGSDLKELRQHEGLGAAHVEEGKLRLTSIIRDFPVPVIAATHGYAIGGGVALAAACDWVVTTSSTRWLMPEVSLGWAPPWGVDDVYRRMGQRALSFLLTNEPLSGEEALRTGLVDVVDEDPVRRARLICTALAEMRPDAIRDLVHMIRSVEMGRYDSSDALHRFHTSFDQSRDRA
jgi:enoyl-CoA hydratase/carnithine racemase